jgi:hypothetical protein
MSLTDTGIMIAPEKLVVEPNELRLWRSVFDAIII